MRGASVLFVVVLVASSLASAATVATVQVGTPVLQFGFLYSDFGVDRERAELEVAHISEADFLVALHVARVTGIDVSVVITWRRGGMSWDAITRRCKRDGRIYYVELPPDVTGPPYGRACGHWKRHPHSDIHLSDAEIRELVLVRSVGDHCGMPYGEVVRQRAHGASPKGIADRHQRGREDASPAAPDKKRPDKQRGSHGKGHK